MDPRALSRQYLPMVSRPELLLPFLMIMLALFGLNHLNNQNVERKTKSNNLDMSGKEVRKLFLTYISSKLRSYLHKKQNKESLRKKYEQQAREKFKELKEKEQTYLVAKRDKTNLQKCLLGKSQTKQLETPQRLIWKARARSGQSKKYPVWK